MIDTGPSVQARSLALGRSGGRCEVCYRPLHGIQSSVHHRSPRRMGGTKRPELNQPANLLVLCGSGTYGCHGRAESYRAWAIERGIILYTRDIPEEMPYVDLYGRWWMLDNQGNKTPHTPPQETGVGSVDTTGRENTP